MRTLNARDYVALPRPTIPWLVEGFLPAKAFALLIGESKAGKSFFALQMCSALAKGVPFMGCATKPNSTVLYVNLDATDTSWTTRLNDMMAHGFELGDRLHFVHPQDHTGPCDVMNLTFQKAIRDTVRDLKPDLIVFDVLRELHHQKEESSTEMKVVMENLLDCTEGVAVLVVHHTVKISNKEDIRIVDLARGSSYMVGKAETVLCLMNNTLYTVPRFAEKVMLKAGRSHGMWVLPDFSTATVL